MPMRVMDNDALLSVAQSRASGLSLDLNTAWLLVNVAQQRLFMCQGEQVLTSFPVSTARRGVGNLKDSYQTPHGWHRIAEKIGADCAPNEILKARQATGCMAEVVTQPISTAQDCITSRILWLSGLEVGVNQNGNVDSYERYIYIHGTHEEGLIGQPASIGCVRMNNADIIELFEQVPEGTLVFIDG